MNLLLDGEAETTLHEFIQANSDDPFDDQDIETIKSLSVGQAHFIPVHAGWCQVKRIA